MERDSLIACMVTQEWTSLMHIQLQNIRGVEEEGLLLRQEVDLLRRVLRRNRDQHVASLFYKKMEHVFRLIVQVCGIVEESVFVYVASRKASVPVMSVCERQVPSVESGIERLESILRQCQLLVSVIQACFKAAKQCCVQLAQSFFMPLSVACLAVSARIQLLSVSLLRHKCNEYNTFLGVVRYLPSRDDPSNGCGIDVAQLPDHVSCSIQKGQIPVLRSSSTVDGMKDRNLLGLYILEPEGQPSTGTGAGCVVTEDHGLPIRREDLMHIIRDKKKCAADTQTDDITPAFETTNVPVLAIPPEEEGPSRVVDGIQKNELGLGAVQSSVKKSETIQVREAVPSLSQRKTEFIRIGGTKSQRQKVKKDATREDATLPMKSWEDWVSLPSQTEWGSVEDTRGKNKRKRMKK